MALDLQHKEPVALALFHAFSVILILGVVLFFYYQMAMKLSINRQKSELNSFSAHLESRIQSILPGEEYFTVPRSFVYDSAFYDREGAPLFSLMHTRPPLLIEGYASIEGRLFLTRHLRSNPLGIGTLCVSKAIEEVQVWQQILWLIVLVLAYLMLSTLWLLERSRSPLLQANKRLKRFMDDAMHELRVPLGVVRLNAEMLQDSLQNSPLSKRVRRIIGASASLESLYGSLEFGMRHGHVEYTPKVLDLEELLTSRIGFFQELAQNRHIRIQADTLDEAYIWMSEEEATRLIDNNLSNAIKYSHEHETVTVTLTLEDCCPRLCFCDKGEGIRDHKKIFERFYRENDTQGGLGLGLGIIHEICEKYRIKIDLNSTPGGGSTFCYTFKNLQNS